MKTSGLFVRAHRRLHRGEDGFALIEAVVAMGIIFVALLTLAMAMLIGLTDAAAARQRQIATGIADKLLEEVRGLQYSTTILGLSDSDLTGDSNIVSCSGTYKYKTCSGEEIQHTAGLSTTPPLVPHTGSYGASAGYPNTYSYSVYLTKTGTTTNSPYRLTILISWTSSAHSTSSTFQTQTLVFQGQSGTTDTRTHVGGTVTRAFNGQGSASSGSVIVTPGPNGVAGLTFDSISATTTSLDADVASEQLNTATAQTTLTSVKKSVSSTVTTSGGTQQVSSADDDSNTSTGTLSQPSAPTQSPPSVSVTGGGGNSITASATGVATTGTCPSSSYSLTFDDGFEPGTTIADGTYYAFFGGTIDSTTKRTGNYSYHATVSNATSYAQASQPATGTMNVFHFAMRFASLPSADVTDLGSVGFIGSFGLMLGYQASTQKFMARVRGAAASYGAWDVSTQGAISAGQWYTFDLKLDTSTTTYKGWWQQDGVDQTASGPLTITAAASTTNNYEIVAGASLSGTFDANYDDLLASQTSADYPIPDMYVYPLQPNGMESGNGNPGTALSLSPSASVSNAWSYLDEVPMSNQSDYVQQTATGSTNYLGITYADPPSNHTCIRGVRSYDAYNRLNSNQANNGKTAIYDGATATTWGLVTRQGTTTLNAIRGIQVTAASAPWSLTSVSGLVARIGYSTDVSPVPHWDSLMLEYAVPVTSLQAGPPGTPGNESGSTVSAMTAQTSYACGNPAQNDSLPCAYATDNYAVSPVAVEQIVADMQGSGYGTCNLYSFTPSSTTGTTSYAYGHRRNTTGDGTVKEEVYRYYGTHTFGGLCSGMTAPAGWLGYFLKFDAGSSASCAVAEAGVSSSAPSTCSVGTISVWNGSGYTTETINSSGDWSPALSSSYSIGQGSQTITITPSVSSAASSTSVSPSGASGTTTRTSATAVLGAPVVGTIRYEAKTGNNDFLDVYITIDLGTLTANAKYTAAA